MLLSSLFSHDPATTEISTLSLHDALPIFEIVEALLASQPLGGTHSAFGETTAGFRVVAEINRVIRRIENNFMHAHDVRSEEHTSELQSRENLVCRLLLEKKKNNRSCRSPL